MYCDNALIRIRQVAWWNITVGIILLINAHQPSYVRLHCLFSISVNVYFCAYGKHAIVNTPWAKCTKQTLAYARRTSVVKVHILSPVTDNYPSWISEKRIESMWSDRVSNPGSLALDSDALPIALRGPASGTEPILRIPIWHRALWRFGFAIGRWNWHEQRPGL